MTTDVLKNPKIQKSYRIDGDGKFSIPIYRLTRDLSGDQALVLTVGIGQFGFSHPTGNLCFEGVSHKIEGFYTEVRISTEHTDTDISFTLSSPSGFVKLSWWTEGVVNKAEMSRISIDPCVDKDYNAALHCYLSLRCNLHCDYCFIPENILREDVLEPIQTERFVNVLNETGKTFNVVFSGGEPFFIPNFVDACKGLSEEHFISIATNLSLSKRIKTFSTEVDPERVKYILCSFHAGELQKRNLTDGFIENYRMLKSMGFAIHSQIVAYPPILKDLETYRRLFAENELVLVSAPYIGEYDNKTYPEAYSQEELDLINCDTEFLRSSYNWKGQPCIAGYNNGVVNSKNDVICCINIKEKIGNIYDRISFRDTLTECPFSFCSVPLSVENYSLHLAALRETRGDT
jgi:organic radical activating enzyme